MTEVFISFNVTVELYLFNPTHIVKVEFRDVNNSGLLCLPT